MANSDTFGTGLARAMKGRIAHDDELGIEYVTSDGAAPAFRLPWAARLTEKDGPASISAGPLAALLDTACGVGAMAALDFAEAVATLDLRIDYVREADEGMGCMATCRLVKVLGSPGNGSVLMQAEATPIGGGEALAYAFGRFIRRSLRNAGTPPDPLTPPAQREPAGSYPELMRFRHGEDNSIIMPFRPGIVGNGSLPSLHGGALAAHLQRAAQQAVDAIRPRAMRLSTANFNFLRFGGPADTTAGAEIEHLGQAVGSVRGQAWQRAGTPNITGLFTFTRIEKRFHGLENRAQTDTNGR